MERCVRCKISETEVKLYSAVYDGKPGIICERCSIIENIPVIKSPEKSNINESERPLTVYERMKRMSGYSEEKKPELYVINKKLSELDERPQKPRKMEIIPHFEWDIMRQRRRKGLTQQRLAEILGVPFMTIERLEKGELPEDSENLIRRIEDFLDIKLTKIDEFEEIAKSKSRPIILRDEYGNVLDKIPEPEIEYPENEEEWEDEEEMQEIKPAPPPKEKSLFARFLGPSKNQAEESPKNSEDISEESDADKNLSPIEEIRLKIAQEKARREALNHPNKEPVQSFLSTYETPKPYAMPYSKGRAALRAENNIDLRTAANESREEKENIKTEKIETHSEKPAVNTNEIFHESGDLDIEKAKLSNTKIGSLREVHRERLNLTKEDKILEARKIEERQRLIEARKEELRILKEKESRDLDSVLGGAELLKKKEESEEEFSEDSDDSDEFDDSEDYFEKFEED